jgi:hypothetical protein
MYETGELAELLGVEMPEEEVVEEPVTVQQKGPIALENNLE